MVRILLAPAKAGGKAYLKVVTAGFGVFTSVLTRIIGAEVLQDLSQFVAALETMFGGFRERAQATYDLLKAPGTAFVVVAAPERDALREAAYFVERLAAEQMPLAGLVVNRVHRTAAPGLTAQRSLAAAEPLESTGEEQGLAAAVLRLHAERVALAAREAHLQERFTPRPPGRAGGRGRRAAGRRARPGRPAGGRRRPGRRPAGSRPRPEPLLERAGLSWRGSPRAACSTRAVSQQHAPADDVRAAAQQRTALPLGHPAPHAELDAVVQRVGEALGAHRAAAAHRLGAVLRGPGDEQLVRVGVAAAPSAPSSPGRRGQGAGDGAEVSWRVLTEEERRPGGPVGRASTVGTGPSARQDPAGQFRASPAGP